MADLQTEIKRLASELTSLRERAPVVPAPIVMMHFRESERVADEDLVDIECGTLSLLQLIPRQASIPRPAVSVVGKPIIRTVHAKKGLAGRLFGPKTERVVGYDDVRYVRDSGVIQRSAVLYQPVVGAGRRRAVCIGISYKRCAATALHSPTACADARFMHQWLTKIGFTEILLLTDDDDSAIYPSRENILKALSWLVAGTRAGDNLFLSISASGGWRFEPGGDEPDGQEECLVPADFELLANPADDKAGYICEDDMYHLLVSRLPDGCMLNCVYDAAHSGTPLDLPYVHAPRRSFPCFRAIHPDRCLGLHANALRLTCDAMFISCPRSFPLPAGEGAKLSPLHAAYLRVVDRAGVPSNVTYGELLDGIYRRLLSSLPDHLARSVYPVLSSTRPVRLDHPLVF